MARTAITSGRAAIASARTAISSPRTAISAFKVPIDFVDMGITHLWDFRTGKIGSNNNSVADLIGTANLNWRGTSALSSVYTSGEYSADLERGNSDYFSSNPLFLTNGATAITLFAWIKQESAVLGQIRHMLSQWEGTSGNFRGFTFRIDNFNRMEMFLSSDGTLANQASYTTSETLTDTTNWNFVLATYDTTNRGQIYLNNTLQTATLSVGSHPASIFSSNVSVLVGANNPSVVANYMDGKIGICGIAQSTALSVAQQTSLYDVTRKLMGL